MRAIFDPLVMPGGLYVSVSNSEKSLKIDFKKQKIPAIRRGFFIFYRHSNQFLMGFE